MYYSAIKYNDIANGLGVRTVLFVSGCRNRCKGCFQPETWDFCNGRVFDKEAEESILNSLAPNYIRGLTLLGGDPFEPENQAGLIEFMRLVKEQYPGKDVWAYTGYVLDTDLQPEGRVFTEYTQELLSYIDVLVDGPFMEEQKSLMLKFKGSHNQRVIDMKNYRETGEIREVEFNKDVI